MRKKPSKLLISSIVSLVIGLILGYWGRNIFGVMFAILIFWLVVIPALAGFFTCALISSLRKKESQTVSNFRSAFKIIMAVAIIQVMTISITGMTLLSHDIEKAKNFCTEVAAKIEHEKEKTGIYPPNIQVFLKEHATPPRFINEGRLYFKNDAGYVLEFVVTGGLFPCTYTYRSDKGEWEIQD